MAVIHALRDGDSDYYCSELSYIVHPSPAMPFDISKLSIDRKIAAASPAGFFVHFIGSGWMRPWGPCGSAALPADSLLRHRPTTALPPPCWAQRPRPPRPPGHHTHTLAGRPTDPHAKWETKNHPPLLWHLGRRLNLILENLFLCIFRMG